MLRFIVIITMALSMSSSCAAYTFQTAKRKLAEIYTTRLAAIGFYSNCIFIKNGKRLVPLPKTCQYKPRINNTRSNRIEWEHVVPAHTMGLQLNCWLIGGRKECTRSSGLFKRMVADMHNLVPSIGELNSDRSNYQFGIIKGEVRKYGLVDFEVDNKRRVIEPRTLIRGDIARIYFYMSDRYGIGINTAQRDLFVEWNQLDPVDDEERARNHAIFKVQGNYNKYVMTPGLNWGCLYY